ncbi:MAG: NifU family protein [Ignavibacteriales bacterium]|nr:NifU family protein [Ignavibacteriales bacterium]
MDPSTIQERIEKALDICRPYLQADGGDIELMKIRDDGVVELKWLGTCVKCPLSPLTLRAGIERTIMHFAPEVRRVESVKPT